MGKDGKINIIKGERQIFFDKKIKTQNGYVLAAIIKPSRNKTKVDRVTKVTDAAAKVTDTAT